MIIYLKKKVVVNRQFFFLLGIFVVAAALRSLSWYCEPLLSRDGTLYARLASGDVTLPMQHWSSPLLPFILKSCFEFGLNVHICGIVLNIFLGSLMPIVVFFISKELKFADKWAYYAGVLIAVHPVLIEFSKNILRENLYLFFSSMIILYLIKVYNCKKNRLLNTGLLGLFTGFAVMSRYEAMEFAFLVFVVLLWKNFIEKKLSWQVCFYSIFVYGITFFITTAGILLLTVNNYLAYFWYFKNFYLLKIINLL